MATPHDDDAPPPAHEPNCLPPEPCVCAGLRATADTVTTADLDLVDKLVRDATPEPWTAGEEDEDEDGIVIFAGQGRGRGFGELWNARRGPDSRFIAAARTLLPRLARELRQARDALADVTQDRDAWRNIASQRRDLLVDAAARGSK